MYCEHFLLYHGTSMGQKIRWSLKIFLEVLLCRLLVSFLFSFFLIGRRLEAAGTGGKRLANKAASK